MTVPCAAVLLLHNSLSQLLLLQGGDAGQSWCSESVDVVFKCKQAHEVVMLLVYR
jgi:hypothetical protein